MPTPVEPNRVLIVSKNDLIIKEIHKVMEAESDFNLIEDFDLRMGVVETIHKTKPDIVLFDFEYTSSEEIFDIIDDVSILNPSIVIIAILQENDLQNANHAILAGARAFLTYPFSHANFLNTVRRTRELHSRLARTVDPNEAVLNQGQHSRTFIVFSPKGGVGCTSVAVNLAIAMHQDRGEEVLLFDGKHLFGDVGLMLNLKTANSAVDLIPHVGTLDENLIRQVVIKHISGINVLPGPFSASIAQPIRPEDLFNIIKGLQEVFPNVVIDGGNYLNDDIVTLMDISQRIALVITPDLASLRDARLFLDIARSLSYPREKIMLLANKVTGKNEVSLREIEKVLRMKIFGTIPFDDIQSLNCLNEGVPIFLKKPNHAISKAYKKFAQNLSNTNFAVTSRLAGESTPEALKRISRLG